MPDEERQKTAISQIVIYTQPASNGFTKEFWDSIDLTVASYESALDIADEGLHCNGELVEWAKKNDVEVNKTTPKSDSEMRAICDRRFSPHGWTIHYHTSPMDIKYWVVVVFA